MSQVRRALVAVVALSVLAACSHGARGGHGPAARPKLFVGHKESSVWVPEFDRTKDIFASCPEPALMWNGDDVDYRLIMSWKENRWSARLFRADFGFLLEEDSPDFNQVLRDSCKAIRYDLLEWLPRSTANLPKPEMTERYELRELRNGGLSTSALLDKKTGKVWVWTELTEHGKKVGKSAFLSEDVVPEPEK